jgi:hypothetical protein
MTGRQWMDEREAMRRALRELKKGGVNVNKAPDEAIDLYVAAHTPPDDNPAFRESGKRPHLPSVRPPRTLFLHPPPCGEGRLAEGQSGWG